MNTAITLEKILIEGKVFKSGATWRILETFFEKKREQILSELSVVASKTELESLEEQIEANQFYDDNVRIIDPAYLQEKEVLPKLFALNSKLCSVDGIEEMEAAKELIGLRYLKIYSSSKNNLATKRFENDSTLSDDEKRMFTAYDYFKSRDKKVMIITPSEAVLRKAKEEGFDAMSL